MMGSQVCAYCRPNAYLILEGRRLCLGFDCGTLKTDVRFLDRNDQRTDVYALTNTNERRQRLTIRVHLGLQR